MLTKETKRHQTKTQTICDELELMAARLGPNGRFPRVQELRSNLGVSLKTLDGALRELEARNVIYRMHGMGVFVAPPAQRTIGLVYAIGQNYGSPFWDMLVEQMRARAEAGHERFRFYLTYPMPGQSVPLPDDLVDAVTKGQLQGLIFVGDQNQAGVGWLQAQKVPLVTFACPSGKYQVNIAKEPMVSMGVRELARRGCKRIGLWVPFGHGVRYIQRHNPTGLLEFFESCLQQHQLPFREEHFWRIHDVLVADQKPSSYLQQGRQAAHEVYGKQPLREAPDGLIIMNDMMTSGAISALAELEVNVGTDVQIISHSNKGSNVLLGYESILTRLEIDLALLVEKLLSTLETLIEGGQPSQDYCFIDPVITFPETMPPILLPLQSRTIHASVSASNSGA